jgi:hypothetical protein
MIVVSTALMNDCELRADPVWGFEAFLSYVLEFSRIAWSHRLLTMLSTAGTKMRCRVSVKLSSADLTPQQAGLSLRSKPAEEDCRDRYAPEQSQPEMVKMKS